MSNTDVFKKYDTIFTNWNEIIEKLKTSNISEEAFENYIKPMWVQTVGGEPIVVTIITPNVTDSGDYDRYYKEAVITTIQEVAGVDISDVYFITEADMEKVYEMYEEEERLAAKKVEK